MPPYTEYFRCAACGWVRGPEVKPQLGYCYGAGAGSKGTDCEAGNEPHFHVTCLRCGYVWVMATLGADLPLTMEEIREVRLLLAQIRAQQDPPG